MGLMNSLVFLLLVSAYSLVTTCAATCEETETAHVKLDLAKQSINNAKLLFPKCDNETDHANCTIKDKSLAHLNAALDLISEAKITCHSCPEPKVIEYHDKPIDCTDVQTKGFNKSGVYTVWPKRHGVKSNKSIEVYCDMETDGGGWTVIQRRGDFGNQTSFYQDWETYKNGFGNIQQEFWLGNENIFSLTNQGACSVRFDLVDVKREYRYAVYNTFSIGDENSGYALRIQGHTGNATDDLQRSGGSKFSTKDKTNDGRGSSACAIKYSSAFWFDGSCGYVNLNGIYQPGVISDKSIWWFNFKRKECLYSAEIKIRRKNSEQKQMETEEEETEIKEWKQSELE